MKTLQLFAKLAQAYKAATGQEVALLLSPETVTLIARGTHPVDETATTAHTAAVNIMQNVNARDRRCLVTYTPTRMCRGMAHNLSLNFLELTDNLDEGDEIGANSLPNPTIDGANFLKEARKLKGVAKAIVDAFNRAVPWTSRVVLSTNLTNALGLLPDAVPSRWAPQPSELVNTYMGLACSMVAMTWSEKNMHDWNLGAPEKLVGNNVGAVIVHNNQVIAWGLNFGAEHLTLHAETVAIQGYLARTGNAAMPSNCVIYSSLQPCHMCAGFIAQCCPNATAVYALRDGQLHTCLAGRESRWNHHVADELGEAIRTARSIGEQHSTTHYLKGEEIKGYYLAALPLLTPKESDEAHLTDLKAHCLEVLRKVAQGGMATGSGIEVLEVAINAESSILESLEEREIHGIDQLVKQYRTEAQKLHRDATSNVSAAKAEYAKAVKFAATLNSQIPLVDQCCQNAEKARDSANEQTSSKTALPFVEKARTYVENASKPSDDAFIAKENLDKALENAEESLKEASSIVQQADNAVSLTSQNRARLPDSRQGGSTTSLEKKSLDILEEIQAVVKNITVLSEKANLDMQQVEHLTERTSSAASSARVARERLIALNSLNRQKSEAEDEAAQMSPEIIAALEDDLHLLRKQFRQLGDQVENYGSDIAKGLALTALENAQINVDKAQSRLDAAKDASARGMKSFAKLTTNVENLRQASSTVDIQKFSSEVTTKATSVKKKKALFDGEKHEFESSLFNTRKLLDFAQEPIKCSSCHRLLVSNTSDKTRWHQCSLCDIYYCNTCGYNLTRATLFYPERKCNCGGTTVLL